MKRALVVLALLAAGPCLAQDISPLQLQLAGACDAKFDVSVSGGERFASGDCARNMQSIFLVGPADHPVAAKVQVDTRPDNLDKSRGVLITVMRGMLDDSYWPSAQKFIDGKLPTLLVPEKTENRFGGYALSIQRTADQTAVMVIAAGPKAYNKAFDW